jgi:threonyl-tRNA synthetase
MAQAVREMFPEAKLAWGPPHDRFENGFYYDFDLPRALTPRDFPDIEERMRRIVRDDHPFHRRVLGTDEARKLFEDQPYKLETIGDIVRGKDEYGEDHPGGGAISTYRHDTFKDLCLLPHLERTGQIPADGFKLLDVSGAYWRGSENNTMLQRVHGTVWPSEEELECYLRRREEEERRDHRRLGAELDLFNFRPEVGLGLALFHPKQGRAGPSSDGGLLAREAPRGRLRLRLLPPRRQVPSLGDKRAPEVVRRRHVFRHRDRGRELPPETHELPVPHWYRNSLYTGIANCTGRQ